MDIDFDNRTYRETWRLFWIEFPGGWKPLPTIEYISVFRAKVLKNLMSRASETTITNYEYQVNLIAGNNQKLTAYADGDKEKAFAVAKDYAAKLGKIKVLDATQKPFVWLD